MDEVTITPSLNGPYLASGPLHLTAPDGRDPSSATVRDVPLRTLEQQALLRRHSPYV